MKLFTNMTQYEPRCVQEQVLAIARRMYEDKEYNKDYIVRIAHLTPDGFFKVVERATIMECARIFADHHNSDFIKENLGLDDCEVDDLNDYIEQQNLKTDTN